MSAYGGALESIDRILDRGGDVDDVLREVVAVLHGLDDFSWVGISFVEEGELVLGPAEGERTGEPAAIPISYEDNVVAELGVVAGRARSRRPRVPGTSGTAHLAVLPSRLGHGRRSLVSLGRVTCLAPDVSRSRGRSLAPAVRRPALTLRLGEANLKRPRARPLSSNGRAPQLLCPLPLALVVLRFAPTAIPETRYLARSRGDPSNEGSRLERGSQLGVTRYASKTASMLRRAVSKPRSSLTSPTSATYQFRAI